MQTCLICDDHALVREAMLGTITLGWPSVSITEAGDFPSAWAQAKHEPDLCIADLVMPGAEPFDGIVGIMKASPTTRILVFTGTQDDTLLLDLLRLGVSGFAPKSASGAVVQAAIALILAGGRYLPPRLADIAAAQAYSTTSLKPAASGLLTARQIEVLKLVSAGQSNKEIAKVLGMAPTTVKTHIQHVLATLGASNRTEASAKARLLGIL
jgi:two-component system, NarL family, nitrate/nitrite response regulator NarL